MLVVLFNYLPHLIIALSVLYAIRIIKKHSDTEEIAKRLIVLILSVCVLQVLLVIATNSVIPKGTVERLPNPEFEGSDIPISDRLRKPERTAEESRKHLEEISDWRADKKKREENK